ncbi:MAG TPA: type II toxin-antitoxin system Phd/YefM family antitoxin [Candidatus Binataceae bacterium]|nr:type II toxin-antitoxin system Phd/YefM family antitoxin [Candidatus Binataceae bacterium]
MARPAQVNFHDAKTHLSCLLKRVMRGEEVIIARAGRPVARLCPLGPRPGPRIPGSAKGRISIASDFDAPIGELERAIER